MPRDTTTSFSRPGSAVVIQVTSARSPSTAYRLCFLLARSAGPAVKSTSGISV